jgi:hypothetical protein
VQLKSSNATAETTTRNNTESCALTRFVSFVFSPFHGNDMPSPVEYTGCIFSSELGREMAALQVFALTLTFRTKHVVIISVADRKNSSTKSLNYEQTTKAQMALVCLWINTWLKRTHHAHSTSSFITGEKSSYHYVRFSNFGKPAAAASPLSFSG